MKADARASQQFLLLSHLYSQKADAAALARLRKELLRPKYTSLELAMGSALGVGAVGGAPASPHFTSLTITGTVSVTEIDVQLFTASHWSGCAVAPFPLDITIQLMQSAKCPFHGAHSEQQTIETVLMHSYLMLKQSALKPPPSPLYPPTHTPLTHQQQ